MIFDDQRVPHENFCLDPKKIVQNLFGKVFADFIEFSLRSSWCRNVQKFSVEVFFDFSQKKACTDRRDWVFHRVQLKFLPDFTVSHKSFQTSVSQYINSISYAYWTNNKWNIICCLGVHVRNLEYVQPAYQNYRWYPAWKSRSDTWNW